MTRIEDTRAFAYFLLLLVFLGKVCAMCLEGQGKRKRIHEGRRWQGD